MGCRTKRYGPVVTCGYVSSNAPFLICGDGVYEGQYAIDAIHDQRISICALVVTSESGVTTRS